MNAPSSKPIVLLVSGEYPPYSAWGGNAYQFHNLARLLNKRGYNVEIIAESDNAEEFVHLDDLGNLVHRVHGSRSYSFKVMKFLLRPLFSHVPLKDLQFAARVAERAFELTHIWGREVLWVETTNWRAETLLLHAVPGLNERILVRIVTPMEEVVRQNGVDRSSWETRAALFQERLQQIFLRHRLYSNEEYKEYFQQRVSTHLFGRPRGEDRLFLLPFSFERVPQVVPRERAATMFPIKLAMVGRIEARKGFEIICRALLGLTPAERARIRIVAAGRDVKTGPLDSYQAMLLERFPTIADTCFEFLGQVSDDELKTLLATADAGLVASTSESFGYNLVETLAAGLPVITSDVGAASEFQRRGIRYVGKFKGVPELTQLFRDLPGHLDDYHQANPDNRGALERIYKENDDEYLDFTARNFDPRATQLRSPSPAPAPVPSTQPIQSIDIIIPSYNRFEELTLSLPSILREAQASCDAGVPCQVTIVYQNEDLPRRLADYRGDWKDHSLLKFVFSSPPSLTRARNRGVEATQGDLVIFVDDDVILSRHFLREHARAANAHPQAAGVVGRIRSRIDRRKVSRLRAVGQIRLSGYIDANFNSKERTATLVPQTPMGANMGYRRERMNACLGARWFDERFTGSAFREETTLATSLFRRGEYLVYAPDAVLYHFESAQGGCANRDRRSLAQLARHFSLEYLFLNRLYEPVPLLRAAAPLLLMVREVRHAWSWRVGLEKAYVNLRGYFGGRALYENQPTLRSVRPSPDTAAPSPSRETTPITGSLGS